ncbi:MAG: hypothetical protein ABIR33_06035 [Pyrinomonadaceae bacterium]
MEKHRRTEITIETRSVTIIRTHNRGDLVRCAECDGRVLTFSVANASLVFGIDSTELQRASLNGGIHAALGSNICGQSIAAYLKRDVRYIED